MEKVKLSELYNMDNGNFANAVIEIDGVVSSYAPITTTLKMKTDELSAGVTKMQSALVSDKGSQFTQQVYEADRLRDLAHAGMSHYVISYTKCSDTNKKAAADTVLHIMKKFGMGSLRRAGLNKETIYLDALLEDLSPEKIADELIQLSELSFWIGELQTKVDGFKAIKADKFEESTSKLDYTPTSVRKEIQNSLSDLASALEGLAAAQVDPAYSESISKINTIILNK